MIRLFIEGTTMLSRPLPLFAALSLCVSAAAFGQAATPEPKEGDKGDKAVTVDGKQIPKSRLDFIVKQRASQGQPDSDQTRHMIMDNLITQEVVAQEADRKGIGKGSDVRVQLELMRQQVLAQALIQDYLKSHPIKDEQMQAEYNKMKAARGDKEYKARHILVDKDTEANDIIAQLKKGKFTETPVQTQFGWHVIQLDDVRAQPFPPYDTVKQQLQARLQEQEVQKYVTGLRSKAKIQ